MTLDKIYLKSELEKQHGKIIPFKNTLGDIIGTAELSFEDGELKSYCIDKLTDVRIKAIVIPKNEIKDDR